MQRLKEIPEWIRNNDELDVNQLSDQETLYKEIQELKQAISENRDAMWGPDNNPSEAEVANFLFFEKVKEQKLEELTKKLEGSLTSEQKTARGTVPQEPDEKYAREDQYYKEHGKPEPMPDPRIVEKALSFVYEGERRGSLLRRELETEFSESKADTWWDRFHEAETLEERIAIFNEAGIPTDSYAHIEPIGEYGFGGMLQQLERELERRQDIIIGVAPQRLPETTFPDHLKLSEEQLEILSEPYFNTDTGPSDVVAPRFQEGYRELQESLRSSRATDATPETTELDSQLVGSTPVPGMK